MFIYNFKFLGDPIHLYPDLSPLSHLLGRRYIRQHRTSPRIRKFTVYYLVLFCVFKLFTSNLTMHEFFDCLYSNTLLFIFFPSLYLE